MKIDIDPYKFIILLILVGSSSGALFAQSPFDAERREEAMQIREKVVVFTDRSLYAVEEVIHFVADHRVNGPIGENSWSSVLYVELVASSGEALAQGKFKLSGGRAEGSLTIPTAALTGNYYLKSYTRWMRNMGPESFSYCPLKIINPYRREVIVPAQKEIISSAVPRLIYTEGILDCSVSRDLRSGQEAVLRVMAKSQGSPGQISYSATVVPEGSIDLTAGQYANSPLSESDSFRVLFLPDLGSGVSISGTVIGPDQEPVQFTTLHFSMLGSVPDYFACMPDKHGRFVLATPAGMDNIQEFFVTPEQEVGSLLEVRIDQEYDSRQLRLPEVPFLLSEEEQELARKIALNIQLTKAFRTAGPAADTALVEEVSEKKGAPFYGTGVKRLLIDDYVRLPNLEEIILNLVPQVQFYREKGKKKIKILSENNSIGIYKPLIMIDNISVFDHEAVLALSPEKIERIDLIDDIYLKGNVAFGGVLAIHSRKGDMAGIDLPESSYFFDYQSFHPAVPGPEPPPLQEDRVPDSRNTFFWGAHLILEQGERMEIPFQAPRTAGRYVVLVRGVGAGGQIYAASASFSVD